MKKLFLIALLVAATCVSFTQAEISKDKKVEIERMLRLTGMEKLVVQMKTQMLANFKKQFATKVPDEFWTKMDKKMDMHELVNQIIPVYDKYYTLEDLKAVNAFYESPVGQKVLANLPQVMQESMQIGREWGEKIGREVGEELKKESADK